MICAPTGKAAFNVGGLTIHSAFNIPAEQSFRYKPLDMQQLNTFQIKYRHLKVVFIDEISMVGQNMFNFINTRLQEILGTTLPFGGISVNAFGDMFQLKPVMDKWIFSLQTNCYSMEHLTTPLWHQYFIMFDLDEIMRQQEDQLFACLLNRLREGHHTVDDIECLKTRLVHGQVDATDYSITHLYTQRSEVNAHNQQAFSKCGAEKDTIVAVDTVSGNFPAHLQKRCLKRLLHYSLHKPKVFFLLYM